MKRILFYYLLIVFSCFILGVLMALAVCISPWYSLGLLVPILLASISTSMLFDKASKHLLGTALLVLFGFLFFYCFFDIWSFICKWGKLLGNNVCSFGDCVIVFSPWNFTQTSYKVAIEKFWRKSVS